jgi:uncharacterized protein YjbI with pentapeptide repeats
MEALMANSAHLKILSQGVHVWNSWRKNRAFISPDLSGADLTNRNFAGINFSNTNLDSVDFTHTNLTGARFLSASLEGTIGLA